MLFTLIPMIKVHGFIISGSLEEVLLLFYIPLYAIIPRKEAIIIKLCISSVQTYLYFLQSTCAGKYM